MKPEINMTKLLTFIWISTTLFACNSQKQADKYRTDYDGLIIEKFDTLTKPSSIQIEKSKIPTYIKFDDNKYNKNNVIYKVGRTFVFKYYYIDKKGDTLLYTRKLNGKNYYDWIFEREDKKDSNSCKEVRMTIKSGLKPFIDQSPDYCQTIFYYEFVSLNGNSFGTETTGLIENPKNVWMHPPRTDFFSILEINPFPYIKAPYVIGNKWTWKLQIGDQWADKRWHLWNGIIENNYNYEIIDKANVITKLGKVSCFIIDGQATSEIGKTYLKAFYNEELGFVKLNYTNIDNTKTIIELEEIN